MRGDAVRVALLTALVAALLASSLAGSAEAPSGVRIPAIPTGESPEAASDRVTVRPGDHFWKLSAHKLESSGVASPVGPYWRRVVDANKDNIRSGDPDLIFPGEVIELPTP